MPMTNAQGKEHSPQCTKHTLKLVAVVHHTGHSVCMYTHMNMCWYICIGSLAKVFCMFVFTLLGMYKDSLWHSPFCSS